MTKKRTNYINNPDFLQAMISYREKVAEAEKSGKPKPQVPPYIGECFIKIATRLSHKPNFINYTFRDEMICDGIENCMQYIDNFDPDKSSNPFAYFTQIIYFAFLRRIDKEKKQLYIKFKLSERLNIDEATSEKQDHPDSQEYIDNFIKSFEESRKSKSKKVKHEDSVNN
jgi:hypothetical protein